MSESEVPGWVAAAVPAAVRLAAEAGSEVDEVLDRAMPGTLATGRLALQVTRLEESAQLDEVATDLAGLLWAECEDVPRIATILGEPAAQAALEAVAEARRRAARRLAEGPLAPQAGAGPDPLAATAMEVTVTAGDAPAPHQARPEADAPAARAVVARSPDRLARPVPSTVARGGRRAAGAMAAGAAAAILVYGRRLRRA